MEFLKPVDPKYLKRAVPIAMGMAALMTILGVVNSRAQENPSLSLTITCSDSPTYGVLDLGPHAEIYFNARNLGSLRPDVPGGIWAYVGKEGQGFRVFGYGQDRDSFTANLDGFIHSIRNQDVREDGTYAPTTFNKGDEVSIMLRRGPYDELNLPYTEYLIQGSAIVDCETDTSEDNPLVLTPDGSVWVGPNQVY